MELAISEECNLFNGVKHIKKVYLINSTQKNKNIFLGKNVFFTNYENELKTMIYLKKKFDLKIIVVDFLKYKNNYIKQLKSCLKLPIISFHEHYDFSKFSDLSINYNIFENFNNKSGEIKLLGYKYIIFNDLIDKYKFKSPRDYIFVSFGGSDYSKLILNFIKNVVYKLPKQNFVIHTGLLSKKHLLKKRKKNLKIINHKDSF